MSKSNPVKTHSRIENNERIYVTECMTCDAIQHSWRCNRSRCLKCGNQTLEHLEVIMTYAASADDIRAAEYDFEKQG